MFEQLVGLSCALYEQEQGDAAFLTLRAAASIADSADEFERLGQLVHERFAARMGVEAGRVDLFRSYERFLLEVRDLAERS